MAQTFSLGFEECLPGKENNHNDSDTKSHDYRPRTTTWNEARWLDATSDSWFWGFRTSFLFALTLDRKVPSKKAFLGHETCIFRGLEQKFGLGGLTRELRACLPNRCLILLGI